MNDSDKGVKRSTNGHYGTAEQQHWQPKATVPELQNVTSVSQKKKEEGKSQQLGQQRQESQQILVMTAGLDPPKVRKDK